jgi:hypothetical protein
MWLVGIFGVSFKYVIELIFFYFMRCNSECSVGRWDDS